ncbi:MAG: hypothetical protein KJ687_07825 [Proteobacteria bacterium]|nr:hypothetical protein [Pseudomonadota bacterium]
MEKTIIVYCEDDRKRIDHPDMKFNFLTWNAQEIGSSSNTLFLESFFNNVYFYF